MAMAAALLPIFILSLIQTQADFREQAEARRVDLQLAAERSAASAKAQLDSAQVLLRALSPDALGPYCAARLGALVDDLEGYEGLYRISATGQAVCASGEAEGLRAGLAPAAGAAWFERLRRGENLVVMRAPTESGYPQALIVAIRSQRPMGRFDGAMAAIIPLSALQPDIEDRALPEGSEAALTDGEGRIVIASDPAAFRLSGGRDVAGWVDRARESGSAVFETRDAQGQRRDYAGAVLAGGDLPGRVGAQPRQMLGQVAPVDVGIVGTGQRHGAVLKMGARSIAPRRHGCQTARGVPCRDRAPKAEVPRWARHRSSVGHIPASARPRRPTPWP